MLYEWLSHQPPAEGLQRGCVGVPPHQAELERGNGSVFPARRSHAYTSGLTQLPKPREEGVQETAARAEARQACRKAGWHRGQPVSEKGCPDFQPLWGSGFRTAAHTQELEDTRLVFRDSLQGLAPSPGHLSACLGVSKGQSAGRVWAGPRPWLPTPGLPSNVVQPWATQPPTALQAEIFLVSPAFRAGRPETHSWPLGGSQQGPLKDPSHLRESGLKHPEGFSSDAREGPGDAVRDHSTRYFYRPGPLWLSGAYRNRDSPKRLWVTHPSTRPPL